MPSAPVPTDWKRRYRGVAIGAPVVAVFVRFAIFTQGNGFGHPASLVADAVIIATGALALLSINLAARSNKVQSSIDDVLDARASATAIPIATPDVPEPLTPAPILHVTDGTLRRTTISQVAVAAGLFAIAFAGSMVVQISVGPRRGTTNPALVAVVVLINALATVAFVAWLRTGVVRFTGPTMKVRRFLTSHEFDVPSLRSVDVGGGRRGRGWVYPVVATQDGRVTRLRSLGTYRRSPSPIQPDLVDRVQEALARRGLATPTPLRFADTSRYASFWAGGVGTYIFIPMGLFAGVFVVLGIVLLVSGTWPGAIFILMGFGVITFIVRMLASSLFSIRDDRVIVGGMVKSRVIMLADIESLRVKVDSGNGTFDTAYPVLDLRVPEVVPLKRFVSIYAAYQRNPLATQTGRLIAAVARVKGIDLVQPL